MLSQNQIGIIIPPNYINSLKKLNKDQLFEFMSAVFEYHSNNRIVDIIDSAVDLLFTTLMPIFDKNMEAYTRKIKNNGKNPQKSHARSVAGKKGAMARWHKNDGKSDGKSDGKIWQNVMAKTSESIENDDYQALDAKSESIYNNIIYNNIKNINNKQKKINKKNKEENIAIKNNAQKVIDAFNEITKTAFKLNDINLKYISHWLENNYSVDDLILTAKYCYNDWANNDYMNRFIRIATIYRKDKFEDYYQRAINIYPKADENVYYTIEDSSNKKKGDTYACD